MRVWGPIVTMVAALATTPALADKTYSCTAVQTKANTSVGDRASVSVTSQPGVCNFSVNGAKSTTAANTSSGGNTGNGAVRPDQGSVSASKQFEGLAALLRQPGEFDRSIVVDRMSAALLVPFFGPEVPQDMRSTLENAIGDDMLKGLGACVSAFWQGFAVFQGSNGAFCQTKDEDDPTFSPELVPQIEVEGLGALLAIGVEIGDADFVTFIPREFAIAEGIPPVTQ